MSPSVRAHSPSGCHAPTEHRFERESPLKNKGFATRAIHAGQDPEPHTGAVIVPIFQTATYAQEDIGAHKGFEYSRTDNPTRTALQETLTALDGAAGALAFAS